MNKFELIKKKYKLLMIRSIAYVLIVSSAPIALNAINSSYRKNNDAINSMESCSQEEIDYLLSENNRNKNIKSALVISNEAFALGAAVLSKMYIEKKYDNEIEEADYDEEGYVPRL